MIYIFILRAEIVAIFWAENGYFSSADHANIWKIWKVYILDRLQLFATKLCNFDDFTMFFLAQCV